MDPEQQSSFLLAPTLDTLASVKVFPLIPALKRDVTLTAADINFSINMSVVYVCLVVRSYFLGAAETELAFAGVMLARANLCEILAMKLLSRFATNYIQLVAVLTTTWSPLAGATDQVVEEVKQVLNARDDDIYQSAESAIEMAISTRAKNFLASPVTQQVVNDIYSGKVVFSVTAHRSILADNYKPRAIEIYNPLTKPFINHYRLHHDSEKITLWETIFIILASAFTLGEYTAATEHGWITSISDMAFDVLACGACILFPRLAFFAVSNNVVVLSLRAMISQFVFFITIAAICFSGLLFTLWTLANNDDGNQTWTLKSIAWLMVQIWFGNTYLSFNQAASFHPFFGPILMTIFAALSNTLLLTSKDVRFVTLLCSYLFQYTITTIEGPLLMPSYRVKSDALFSYQPPFNILAFVILKPASWFLTPRALHSANAFLIKLTSLPHLIIIGLYERYWMSGRKLRESSKDAAQSLFNSLPRHIKNMPLMEALVGSASNDLYDAIFEVEIDDEDYDIFDDSDAEHDSPHLYSQHSHENLRNGARSPRRPTSLSRLTGGGASGRDSSPTRNSPKQRVLSPAALAPIDVRVPPEGAPSPALSNNRSPLARLFSSRFPSIATSSSTAAAPETSNSALAAEAVVQAAANSETSLRHIESLLDAVSQLPVHKLKEEMKELQDRQARIENLLLMLTRGMRNETPQPAHRNSTMT
ncbi:receptor-activated Ca2+-permeable cation channel [Pholiota molesta]|nr:receptor-activated Ca2+-permeable cation channel [Pholiota molesta]